MQRIQAIILQEYYTVTRALESFIDVFIFPLINIILFGFLSQYLTANLGPEYSYSLLLNMVLWQELLIIQYSIAVSIMWNVWSRNLTNIFITPISILELMTAQSLMGIGKSLVVLLLAICLSPLLFGFNILEVGVINLILYMMNLIIFGISAGLFVIGLIFRFGTRMQAFAWGSLPLLQPISAVFYPVKILPPFLQAIAYLIPTTYIFEASRISLQMHTIEWGFIGLAFAENIIYFIGSVFFFQHMFRKSKETGQFARNES